MAVNTEDAVAAPTRIRRAISLDALAVFALLLAIVTGIPQFYYVLFGLHLVPIGPNTNPLGEVWYAFILHGDNSYQHVDPGFFAGAVEDAFLLSPLYIATGIGLLLRRAWVVPVGLICGSMLFYGILQLLLGEGFAGLTTVTDQLSYWLSNLPYLAFPLWLIPTLLLRRSQFHGKQVV